MYFSRISSGTRLPCSSPIFYQRYGFYKIGEEQGSRVPLDILEKYIGYDR